MAIMMKRLYIAIVFLFVVGVPGVLHISKLLYHATPKYYTIHKKINTPSNVAKTVWKEEWNSSDYFYTKKEYKVKYQTSGLVVEQDTVDVEISYWRSSSN